MRRLKKKEKRVTNKKFKMKNYTTEVPATKSIAEIEKILASFGASAIIKEYTTDGKVRSLSFKLGNEAFKLPANVNGVKEVMYAGRRNYHGRDSMKFREDKAYRVAWRIIKDWIHSHLSLISSGQAFPQEVFLPYMYDGKRTLYEKFVKDGKLLAQKNINE